MLIVVFLYIQQYYPLTYAVPKCRQTRETNGGFSVLLICIPRNSALSSANPFMSYSLPVKSSIMEESTCSDFESAHPIPSKSQHTYPPTSVPIFQCVDDHIRHCTERCAQRNNPFQAQQLKGLFIGQPFDGFFGFHVERIGFSLTSF